MDRIIGKPDFSKAVAAAIRTAKWATVMTKWRVGFEPGGKRLGSGASSPRVGPRQLLDLSIWGEKPRVRLEWVACPDESLS